jgi:hypothetical protein
MAGDGLTGKVRLGKVGEKPRDRERAHRATEGGGSHGEDRPVAGGRLKTRFHQSPPPPGLGLGDGEDVTGGVGLGLGWCRGVGVALGGWGEGFGAAAAGGGGAAAGGGS